MDIGDGTKVIVTGASKGIGRATAKAFTSRGARVGLVSRSSDALEALAAELPGAVPLAADVADRAAVRDAVDRFCEETGDIDVAVANAGIAHYGPFTELGVEPAEEMTRVNWLGTLYTVDAVLPRMLDRASGHVVIVSSGAGQRAFPSAAAYGATKAAQRAFAESLRHELSGTGVSVTTVYPGQIDTELHAHERERLPDWARGDGEPPEEIASAIVAAVEEDRRELYQPPIVRLLGLNGLAPGIVDRLLRAVRGPTAAPRRD